MKARIKKAAMKIIGCGIDEQKRDKLKTAADQLGAQLCYIEKTDYDMQVGLAVGFEGFKRTNTNNRSGECIIFSGFDSKAVDRALDVFDENDVDVSLKCVVTSKNQSWSIGDLIEELKREQANMN